MQGRLKSSRWTALTITIVLTSIAAPAQAAPGDPDTAFSGDGFSSTPFGTTVINGSDQGLAAVAAPGGGYFASGTSGDEALVAKYTSAGALDTSFAGDGIAFAAVNGASVSANALSVDSSGRPVIAGDFNGSEPGFFVARLTTAGDLDATFSADGSTTVGFGADAGADATAVTHLPDGRIAVSGSYSDDDSDDFAVALLTSGGALDSTFGAGGAEGDGRVVTDIGGDSSDRAEGIAVTAGPRINVVGGIFYGGPPDRGDFAVARYELDGDLDGTFSGDGKQTVDITGPVSGNPDFAWAADVDGAGNLVLGGQAGFSPNPPSPCSNTSLAAARLTPTGAPDTTFAGDGSGTYDVPGAFCTSEQALSMDIQANGLILLGGHIFNQLPSDNFIAARVEADGDLDTTFDGDGYAQVDFTDGGSDTAEAVIADDAAGGVLLAGTSNSGANGDVGLARLNMTNGSPDTSFGPAGSNGRVETDVPRTVASSETARDVVQSADGKLIVVGPTNVTDELNRADFDFGVARYNPDGTLDATFGVGGPDGAGRVSSNFSGGSGSPGSEDDARAVALQPDGKIVVAGFTGTDLAVARYTTAGVPDTGFGGGDGLVSQDLGGAEFDRAYDVATSGAPGSPDFRIVLAGVKQENPFSEARFALAAYEEDGASDTDFGTGGVTLTKVGPSAGPEATTDTGRAIEVLPDGKFLVAGETFENNPQPNGDFALARYSALGVLDATFAPGGPDGDGVVLTDFTGEFDTVRGLSVREVGGSLRAVVVGSTAISGGPALAAYTAAGVLDPAFGPGGAEGDGKVQLPLPTNNNALNDVVLDGTGLVYVTGAVADSGSSFGAARLTPSGALDSTFSGDGVVSRDVPNGVGQGLLLQADGRLVIAGGDPNPQNGTDFVVDRYLTAPDPVVTPPVTNNPPIVVGPTPVTPTKPKCKKKKAKKGKKKPKGCGKKKPKKKK